MEVSMGKSSINDGFSSKPCLMTPEGNMVYSWRWLSFGSCQTQFMFIPTWVMISPCHFTMPFHFGKSEPQILSFKLWHGATTRALDDFFQAQMSTLERIECYLGAFESGSPHFSGRKKGGSMLLCPNGDIKVDLEQVGHTERNWKQGASQEIAQWCAFPVKCEAVEIMHISLYQSVVDPCSSGPLPTPPPKSNYPQSTVLQGILEESVQSCTCLQRWAQT